MSRIDVLGIGAAAIDDTIYISGVPPADGKARVLGRSRNFGGQTATALAAAARLGATSQYAGMLGSDPDSLAVVRDLRKAGVVVPRKAIYHDARPVRSTIITSVDRGTRSIYFDNPPLAGADPNIPESTVRSARVLLLDGFGIEGSLRAAQVAHIATIPVVADIEVIDAQALPRLLEFVDHLILSAHVAQVLTGTADFALALRTLWNGARKLAAITDGAHGCWVATSDRGPVEHIAAYEVVPVDTTGCGDVFHGAYAAALAFGYPILGAIRFATVAAALKASRLGTREGLPHREEVEARL